MNSRKDNWNRRQFIAAAGALGVANAAPARGVSIILDSRDPIASAAPSRWAARQLHESLTARGVSVQSQERIAQSQSGNLHIIAAASNSPLARGLLKSAGANVASVPEALGLVPGKIGKEQVILATGYDSRGLVYALLELADRVANHSDPLAALTQARPNTEQPANEVRAVSRLFTSDVEDKPWYNDREMWPRYLTMLATQRFNRFHLALGIGYDFIRQVTDAYFLFSYPFLLDVPGYKVRVPQLPNTERDSNLAMLKFISEQTVARGMEFQLGLWMHGYEWINSPNANYTTEGLTPATHGPYCRDAVRMLLKACPAISGVTFRVHGESGVEEGSYDFWRTVFEGVATCGRKVEIDMHSKGMDQTMLDMAVATRQPVRLSPKFWGEHLGMTYHQADIRELEKPKKDGAGLMKFSAGSRAFLRYGYGDLLRDNRQWSVIHRIWPGTQRLLLWGDPQSAAAYSRAFSFCGSKGADIMEPLSFKGRRGSGIAGDRCAYLDVSLRPHWDWQKYEYEHRVWGRALYNPDADPDTWARYLRRQFGEGAGAMESALANASRILPIVTTAHAASAGNNSYWPEVYLNHSMVDADHPGPYTDSPAPRVFGNVSPLDPQLFSRINDFADELLKGELSPKYSPVEVAQWLENFSTAASANLAHAEVSAARKSEPEYRRFAIDIAMQSDLGRFFAAKFRAGVLYRIYEQTGDRVAIEQALAQYRKARAVFADLADRAKPVYQSDITIGENPQLRGHWLDRLPAMDKDIALVAAKLTDAKPSANLRVAEAIEQALGQPHRSTVAATCKAPASFQPGQPLEIDLLLEKKPMSVQLCYRRVNQAERWVSAAMTAEGLSFHAVIPPGYTDSHYPLEYYFEVKESPRQASLYPGFAANLNNQPYLVVLARN